MSVALSVSGTFVPKLSSANGAALKRVNWVVYAVKTGSDAFPVWTISGGGKLSAPPSLGNGAAIPSFRIWRVTEVLAGDEHS
jgi:hypothetical protein